MEGGSWQSFICVYLRDLRSSCVGWVGRKSEIRNSNKGARGWELAPGSDLCLTAEMEGWYGVGHQPLADGGESRRPEGVSN